MAWAELGAVAAGDDLGLLDELQRQRRADEAEGAVGGVEPVDEELVLGAGGAVEGEADAVSGGAGGELEDGGVGAADGVLRTSLAHRGLHLVLETSTLGAFS